MKNPIGKWAGVGVDYRVARIASTVSSCKRFNLYFYENPVMRSINREPMMTPPCNAWWAMTSARPDQGWLNPSGGLCFVA